jgi:hypothetical protein
MGTDEVNMVDTSSFAYFMVALFVSTVIIYIVTKLFREKEGIVKAFLAAVIGTVIYFLAYQFLGNGLLAALVAGIVWLLALKGLYKIGWVKALFIAIIIWVFATVIGLFLPTLSGPF